jgi:hypothetical protein
MNPSRSVIRILAEACVCVPAWPFVQTEVVRRQREDREQNKKKLRITTNNAVSGFKILSPYSPFFLVFCPLFLSNTQQQENKNITRSELHEYKGSKTPQEKKGCTQKGELLFHSENHKFRVLVIGKRGEAERTAWMWILFLWTLCFHCLNFEVCCSPFVQKFDLNIRRIEVCMLLLFCFLISYTMLVLWQQSSKFHQK